MSVSAALVLLAQAVPTVPAVTVTQTPIPAPRPWYRELYILQCNVIDADGQDERFMLTIADEQAAIVGGKRLELATDGFVKTEAEPAINRGQAYVRRIAFSAGNNQIFIRQLFEEGDLSKTLLVIGKKAANDRTMGFEHAAGFCTKMTSTPEASE